MNTNRQPHWVLARKASVKRRYGASMPTTASDTLRRRYAPPGSRNDANRADAYVDQCHARLAAMPTDFLDWLEAPPAWPEDARERIGETADEV